MAYWELSIDCDERLFPAAILRLKQQGLTSCLVDRRAEDRIGFRVFLPEEIERPRLLGLSRRLTMDAERLAGRPTRVSYRKTDACEAPILHDPTPVGPRLVVQPATAALPDDGRIAVRLLPRAAFGGTHPTTRLCLEALQRLPLAGATLADVGCGSGVLSIAARLLGAAEVAAVDIDPVAVEVTRENAALNGVDLWTATGGVERLSGRRFDTVVCNALLPVLEQVIPQLGSVTRRAVISGMRAEERERVEAACAAAQWTIRRFHPLEGWASAELERNEA